MARLERVLPAAQHLPPASILPLLLLSDNCRKGPPLVVPFAIAVREGLGDVGSVDEVGAFEVGDCPAQE